VVFEDLFFANRPYDPWLAYGQSKTANVLFAVEATRRWAADGITANAVHPGAIATTNLSRHMDREVLAQLRAANTYKTIEQGAATSVLLASSPLLKGIGGRYFEDCHQSDLVGLDGTDVSGLTEGVAAYALDTASAEQLWEVSERLLHSLTPR
jgi:NAD(P)-dependent dehydrogenase (short-subunit alcohol dehydrogenase family)